jgi:cytochrome-b5 reductase
VTRAEGLGPEGKPLMRPYTPIHSDRPGVLSLLVKEYATGTMSKYLCSVKPGDKVGIKGPLPKFKYVANDYKAVTLIAGGSGITPVLQLLKAIVDNKDDKTKVDLVFANVSQADILLKEDLDDIAAKHKDQVKVTYVIDKPEAGFKGPTGFLTKDLLSTIIAKPAPQTKVFVCGPPGFMKAVSGSKAPDYSQGEIDGALKELGFDKDGVFKF